MDQTDEKYYYDIVNYSTDAGSFLYKGRALPQQPSPSHWNGAATGSNVIQNIKTRYQESFQLLQQTFFSGRRLFPRDKSKVSKLDELFGIGNETSQNPIPDLLVLCHSHIRRSSLGYFCKSIKLAFILFSNTIKSQNLCFRLMTQK